jgi:hypothetical protein
VKVLACWSSATSGALTSGSGAAVATCSGAGSTTARFSSDIFDSKESLVIAPVRFYSIMLEFIYG